MLQGQPDPAQPDPAADAYTRVAEEAVGRLLALLNLRADPDAAELAFAVAELLRTHVVPRLGWQVAGPTATWGQLMQRIGGMTAAEKNQPVRVWVPAHGVGLQPIDRLSDSAGLLFLE